MSVSDNFISIHCSVSQGKNFDKDQQLSLTNPRCITVNMQVDA